MGNGDCGWVGLWAGLGMEEGGVGWVVKFKFRPVDSTFLNLTLFFIF